MDCHVGLRPSPSLAQPADTFPQAGADIGCHAYSMAVFFRLHFAYGIQTGARERDAFGRTDPAMIRIQAETFDVVWQWRVFANDFQIYAFKTLPGDFIKAGSVWSQLVTFPISLMSGREPVEKEIIGRWVYYRECRQ